MHVLLTLACSSKENTCCWSQLILILLHTRVMQGGSVRDYYYYIRSSIWQIECQELVYRLSLKLTAYFSDAVLLEEKKVEHIEILYYIQD